MATDCEERSIVLSLWGCDRTQAGESLDTNLRWTYCAPSRCLARGPQQESWQQNCKGCNGAAGMSLKSVHEYRWIKEVLQHQGYIIHPMVSTCFLWIVALVISCFFSRKLLCVYQVPVKPGMCWWRISMYASVCVCLCVCFQIVGTTAQPAAALCNLPLWPTPATTVPESSSCADRMLSRLQFDMVFAKHFGCLNRFLHNMLQPYHIP